MWFLRERDLYVSDDFVDPRLLLGGDVQRGPVRPGVWNILGRVGAVVRRDHDGRLYGLEIVDKSLREGIQAGRVHRHRRAPGEHDEVAGAFDRVGGTCRKRRQMFDGCRQHTAEGH